MLLPNYPFRVEIEITDKCNLNCIYCYTKPSANIIPSKDKINYLLKKTKEQANPFDVVLLGGEPFIRNDMVDILKYAYNLFENKISISTNGTLLYKLSNEKLVVLKNIFKNSLSLQISLDSTNPIINNKTRGLGELTLKGINILEKNNIKFNIGIVVTAMNYKDIISTAKSLASYKNIASINLELLQPSFSIEPKNYFMLRKENINLIKLQRNVEKEVSKINKNIRIVGSGKDCKNNTKEKALIDLYNLKTCTAGLLRAGILANGDVVSCLITRNKVFGNLYREDWKTIWDRAKNDFFNNKNIGKQCDCINLLRKNNCVKKLKIESL